MPGIRTSISPPAAPPGFGATTDAAAAEIAAGLMRPQALIAPKYFYDALGSKLFEAICALDEYYLTRTEAGIFRDFAEEIAGAAGTGAVLIDLGAGNCAKAASLFGVLRPRQYVPVDISAAFLEQAVRQLRREYPEIPMQPVGLDFAEHLRLPSGIDHGPKLFFYPGSSLGNFTPLQARQFLRRLRAADGEAAILLGIDLVKDHAVLEAAYDDALGVTAAFNRNVLRHANLLLGSDFNIAEWRHRAVFNPEQSRMEMYLEATRALRVTWPGGMREFAAGARIHTENSYKYTVRTMLELLETSGFGDAQCWSDPGETYLVCHARAR